MATSKTARRRAWSTFVSCAALASQALALTTVRTYDADGSLVGGMDLYLNGTYVGKSGFAGVAFLELKKGDIVTGRLRMAEIAHTRQFHSFGSGQHWAYRTYFTNVTTTPSGSTTTPSVVDPTVPFSVQVSNQNVLIGLNWGVSLEWDATSSEMTNLKQRMTEASDYLYNATDGQFFIEHVWVADGFQQSENSDAWAFTNLSYRANVRPYGGGFLQVQKGVLSYMKMARTSLAVTYVHEFGHYGLSLADEYKDDDPSSICTGLLDTADPNYSRDQAEAACVMYQQRDTSKFCSSTGPNAHNNAVGLGSIDCWSRIASIYEVPIPFEQTPDIITPQQRGSYVKTMQRPIPSWTPTFQTFDQDYPGLIGSKLITTYKNASKAIRVDAFSYDRTTNRLLNQGKIWINDWEKDGDNQLLFTGLHVGDAIYVPNTYDYEIPPPVDDLPIQMQPNPTHVDVKVATDLVAASKVRFVVTSGEALSSIVVAELTPVAPSTRARAVTVPLRRLDGRRFTADVFMPNLVGKELLLRIVARATDGRESTTIAGVTIDRCDGGEYNQMANHDGSVTIRMVRSGSTFFGEQALFGPSDKPAPDLDNWQVYQTPTRITRRGASTGLMAATLIFHTDEEESGYEYQIVKWNSGRGAWIPVSTNQSEELGVMTASWTGNGDYALLRRSVR